MIWLKSSLPLHILFDFIVFVNDLVLFIDDMLLFVDNGINLPLERVLLPEVINDLISDSWMDLIMNVVVVVVVCFADCFSLRWSSVVRAVAQDNREGNKRDDDPNGQSSAWTVAIIFKTAHAKNTKATAFLCISPTKRATLKVIVSEKMILT